ncbi:MAG: MTH938/NDUFAF3 family protein [Candidatus Aenigmarchaeota archaeon]|nr:MTH938/NDUFAF3 family protein [Candidatus Aenigmarchaeota archaeon]
MVSIDSFYFGNIIIKGRKFTNDVSVSWDGEVIPRQSSHIFSENDFHDMIMKEPEIVVIGTGTAGQMKVDPGVSVKAGVEGVQLVIKPTAQAVEEFNKYSRRNKVIGIFHLTC